jgi:hypothetical protein
MQAMSRRRARSRVIKGDCANSSGCSSAGRRYSRLICLQALDKGDKDGTINHVLGAMNPRVVAWEPSAEDASHDFLWRVRAIRISHLALAARASRPASRLGRPWAEQSEAQGSPRDRRSPASCPQPRSWNRNKHGPGRHRPAERRRTRQSRFRICGSQDANGSPSCPRRDVVTPRKRRFRSRHQISRCSAGPETLAARLVGPIQQQHAAWRPRRSPSMELPYSAFAVKDNQECTHQSGWKSCSPPFALRAFPTSRDA